jgi:uncharacterized membrane protein YhaH (DUF805 family)
VFGGLILLVIILPPPDPTTAPTLEEITENPWLAFSLTELLLFPIIIFLSITTGVKRCHDRDYSGWFVLLYFVPLVQFWLIVELLFLRGTRGPNRFGSDPGEKRPQSV